MKFTFLGTAAAEGFPAVFCDCPKCRRAAAAGGKNIRTRSQSCMDEKLLIDLPCDTYLHMLQNGLDLLKVRNILITHIHEDHFYPRELFYLNKGFSHPPADWPGITVWGSEDVRSEIEVLREHTHGMVRFQEIHAFTPVQIDKYTVTPLPAFHGTKHPYIYMITNGEKTILYAHDTDIFLPEVWEYLEREKPYFHMVSMDCTEGAMDDLEYNCHMCLGRNIRCRQKMACASCRPICFCRMRRNRWSGAGR